MVVRCCVVCSSSFEVPDGSPVWTCSDKCGDVVKEAARSRAKMELEAAAAAAPIDDDGPSEADKARAGLREEMGFEPLPKPEQEGPVAPMEAVMIAKEQLGIASAISELAARCDFAKHSLELAKLAVGYTHRAVKRLESAR